MGFLLFALLVVAGVSTTHGHADNNEETVLFVPNPPSASTQNDEFDLMYDVDGNIKRVSLNEPGHGRKQKMRILGSTFNVANDVRFELFTPENPTEAYILQFNNKTSVTKSQFKSSRPTRILIHGWHSEGVLTAPFANAYLVEGKHKVNFISVNWQKGSDWTLYSSARGRVKNVAEHVGSFVDFMIAAAELKTTDLTIVGHSLGAHIAGIAGKTIKKTGKGTVNKIVGLDPPAHSFDFEAVDERIAHSDAKYVEVIHTSAGDLGFIQPLADVDFYPNGGQLQSGCYRNLVKRDWFSVCSHQRSYEFYIESISNSNSQFLALQCKSFDELQKGSCTVPVVPVYNATMLMGGEPGNIKGRGIFYLQTNDKPMYSKGKAFEIQRNEIPGTPKVSGFYKFLGLFSK